MFPTRDIYLALLLAAAYPAAARAAFVAINDPNISLNTANPSYPNGLGSTIFQTKYRLSASNFDLATAPYGGTGTAGTTWIASNFGNVNQLSDLIWNFTITNNPGAQNLIVTFSRTGSSTVTQTWGTGGTATLTAPDLNNYGPQSRSYNSLRITARSSTSGATAAVSNLSFSATGLAPTAASNFRNDTATPTTSGPALSNFPVDPLGFYTQWIVTDANLASLSWTLAGQVVLSRTGGGDGEAVRFTVDGLETLPLENPEPVSALLTGAGLILLGRFRFPRV